MKIIKHLLTNIIIIALLSACSNKDKNNLENSTWKACGDYPLTDVLVFGDKFLYVKNDSIYWHKNDSLIGVVDTITLHYGERRLYVKDIKNGNIGRYCEQ